jgi:L-aminopeptidase/D-esterase-like protein
MLPYRLPEHVLTGSLTSIPGIKAGHASDFDALTGVTVVLCEKGAVAGYDIGGGASGTEEFEVMQPSHVAPLVHAVTLAGGSAFGLEAASGVRRYLEQKGVGFPTGRAVVPIVPCAILYDLGIGKAHVRPTREMGEAAAAAAGTGPVAEGCVGAGTGATVGKVLGIRQAMKSGVGSAAVQAAGATVAALAAVNAYGDVLDPATGRILAGARQTSETRDFAGAAALVRAGRHAAAFGRANTTLAVVATDARLTKVQCTRLARLAQHGFVRSIAPVHTSFDGDLVIVLSLGAREAPLESLGLAAADAVAQAVVRGVTQARSMGGLPGLAG